MKVTLQHPVTLGEVTVSELEFPEVIETRHILATDGCLAGSVAADNALLESLTGVSQTIINKIEISDRAKLNVELSRIWHVYFGLKDTYVAGGDTRNPPKAETF
ncbi:MAG: phage tail assembly protein [Treponemataceae bacterium]